jgi:hypothetical protein
MTLPTQSKNNLKPSGPTKLMATTKKTKKSAPKKAKKVVKKPAKLKYMLKDFEDNYVFWTATDLANLKFSDLLEIALENKITLSTFLVADATSGEHLINKVSVVKELEKSLSYILEAFPTVKYYIDQRLSLMNLHFIQA